MLKQDFSHSSSTTGHLFECYTNSNIERNTSSRLLNPTFLKKMPIHLSGQLDFYIDLNKNYLFSERVFYNHTLFHSESYKRCKKSCDNIVRYQTASGNENFGVIKEFFEVESEIYVNLGRLELNTFDFFKDLTIKNRAILDEFMFTKFYYIVVKQTDDENVVKMSSILNKCIMFNVNEKIYLTDFLYDREHD